MQRGHPTPDGWSTRPEFNALFRIVRLGRPVDAGGLHILGPFAGQLRLDDTAKIADGHIENALGLLARAVTILEARAQRIGFLTAFCQKSGRTLEAGTTKITCWR